MNPESIEMFQTVLSFGIAVTVAITLYTFISPLIEGDKQKKRMKAVTSERDTMRRAHLDSLQSPAALRSESGSFIKKIVNNLSLESLLATPALREKLMQAGKRGQRPLQMFYFFRLVMPIALFAFGALFFLLMNPFEWNFIRGLFATMALTLLGYYAPDIYLKNEASKRQASILPFFPDALDLLLICVESGMSIELAFGKVSSEMAESSIELAEEFSITTAELSYLQSRRMAYENLGRRNNHVGIRAVSTALVQSERYGTPLGSTLRTMADENRQLRVLQAEKKAAALPAKLTVPMIVFFLPVLFIVILTPAVIRIGKAFAEN